MEKSIHLPRYKAFLKLLKETRIKRGYLQQDMAEALSTTQSAYSKLETGDRRIDLVQLETLCKAMDMTLLEFVAEFEKLR